jgi:hypothetical protein
VFRNSHQRIWVQKAVSYWAAATVAGLVAGGLIGWLGALLGQEARLAVGGVVAVGGMTLGGLDLFGRPVAVLQFDRETPKVWLRRGPLAWSVRNGASLGLGVFTRLGFWSWYAVPLGALLTGSAVGGSVVYGLYGLTRGGSAVVILLTSLLADFERETIAEWLTDRRAGAGRLAAFHVTLLGAFMMFTTG